MPKTSISLPEDELWWTVWQVLSVRSKSYPSSCGSLECPEAVPTLKRCTLACVSRARILYSYLGSALCLPLSFLALLLLLQVLTWTSHLISLDLCLLICKSEIIELAFRSHMRIKRDNICKTPNTQAKVDIYFINLNFLNFGENNIQR